MSAANSTATAPRRYHKLPKLSISLFSDCTRLCYLVLSAAILPALQAAQSSEITEKAFTETSVKAAYILNFAKFTEWPPSKVGPANSPLVIGVCGDSEIAEVLETLIKRKPPSEHPFIVRKVKDADAVAGCHLIYVDAKFDLRNILDISKQQNVLTFGNESRFAPSGGMVQFVKSGDNMLFDVNVGAIEAAGLHLSAKVLKLSRKIIQLSNGGVSEK